MGVPLRRGKILSSTSLPRSSHLHGFAIPEIVLDQLTIGIQSGTISLVANFQEGIIVRLCNLQTIDGSLLLESSLVGLPLCYIVTRDACLWFSSLLQLADVDCILGRHPGFFHDLSVGRVEYATLSVDHVMVDNIGRVGFLAREYGQLFALDGKGCVGFDGILLAVDGQRVLLGIG